eukprot:CAMPEP_0197306732 /NCGR_PEP_ID=MMETSP0891-20130614/3949_1 /TAXON_ID=44058 ORGANISM="Aureoumbra lagunensis, Strain CCMP1510" /NCGR_SAMPLE_ID=MMETSP0891 /ASSEMBLY_ACC=CAM_ASM_000534 /LENGTH=41 /DNA_ID= /DNA_START= /DNA_END= /DNA_ORIENTATION=
MPQRSIVLGSETPLLDSSIPLEETTREMMPQRSIVLGSETP